MDRSVMDAFSRQFSTASKLVHLHLKGLTDDECLWRPATKGLHVHHDPRGWRADWPEREDYEIGPASIAWLTWHIGFWWSMVLNYSFGDRTLSREDVHWPGSAKSVREWLEQLDGEWRQRMNALTSQQLSSTELTRWPFQDRPFMDLVAWVTLELTKNAAEIGYVRFLYASKGTDQRTGQADPECPLSTHSRH